MFLTTNAANNVWLQLVSSNMVPFPQYYDDTSANHTQFSSLAAASASQGSNPVTPLVLSNTTKCNPTNASVGCCGYLQTTTSATTNAVGVSVILDDCSLPRSVVCKWTPSPPPTTQSPSVQSPSMQSPSMQSPAAPPPLAVAAAPAVPAAAPLLVTSMSSILSFDFATLADPAKLAGFKTSYASVILTSLPTAKACNVTSVSAGSVVVAYTVTFLASDFASTDALSAYITTTFGSPANFFSLFPTSFTPLPSPAPATPSSRSATSAAPRARPRRRRPPPSKTPLIVGLVVGLVGGAILIGAVLLVVLLRRRSTSKGKVSKVSDFPASADGPDDASATPVSQMKTTPSPQPKPSVKMVGEAPAAPTAVNASNAQQLHATPPSLVL
ncbi:MAG: hypothetical protein WDW38_001331 [Sanguina aurantia]